MARVVFGGGVALIQGKVGGSVFQGSVSGPVLKNWAKPCNSHRASQVSPRGKLALVASAWRQLTDGQRASWEAWAATHPLPDKLVRSRSISAFSWFTKHASKLYSWQVDQSVWGFVPGPMGHEPHIDRYFMYLADHNLRISSTQATTLDYYFYHMWGKGLINDLLSVWPFAGTSLQSALVPVIDRMVHNLPLIANNMVSGDYAQSGAMRGVKGNGTSKSLVTAASLTSWDQPLGLAVSSKPYGDTPGYKQLVGCEAAGNSFGIIEHTATPFTRGYCGGTGSIQTNTIPGDGQLALCSHALNDLALYRDGVLLGTTTNRATETLPGASIAILGNNNAGTVGNWSDRCVSLVAVFECGTKTKVAQLLSLLAGLDTSLRL